MKKATLLFLLMLGLITSSFSQTVSIINTDTSVCAGSPITLKASYVNLPPLTNNYSVSQMVYKPDTFIGSTQVTLADDDQTLPISLPFKFCYFGYSYNAIIIASNGWVGFSLGQPNSWAGALLPNSSGNMPRNCIMLPYQDLDPHAGGAISYSVYGTAPYRRFVISYHNVPYFYDPLNPSSACTSTFTGQVKLYESTNKIETHIASKPICAWNSGVATHALHDASGINAIFVNNRNYTTWSTANEAHLFTPSGNSSAVISWFCGNTQIGTGTSISYQPTQNCNVYAVVNYGCGTTGEDTSQLLNISVSNLKFSIPDFFVTPISCNGNDDGALKVNVVGGVGAVSYLWNTMSTNQSISGLSGGLYSCSIKDASGCIVQKNYTLPEPNKLSIVTDEIIFPKCHYSLDGKIIVSSKGGTAPYLYQWSNGLFANIIKDIGNGNYNVVVKDAHQCIDSMSVTLFTPEVKLNAGSDRYIGPNESTMLHAEVSPQGSYSYLWLPNAQLNANNTPYVTATPHKPTRYTVWVTSSTGCVYKDSVVVKVRFDENLLIYNAFTPNNDGQNDVFTLKKYNDLFVLDHLNIFNRWGKEVYSTNDINQGWDGTWNGQPQEIGTYMYEVSVKDFDGQPHVFKGNISLLR
jgi:gliding motility-associated-like protein